MLYRLILTTMAGMLLIGCGFHLRGNYSVPENCKHIVILSDKPYDKFQYKLKKTLAKNNVKISPSKEGLDDDITTLELSEPKYELQTLAVTSDGKPTRFRMQQIVNYKINNNENKLIKYRDFSANTTFINVSEREKLVYKKELIDSGVNELLRRLFMSGEQ